MKKKRKLNLRKHTIASIDLLAKINGGMSETCETCHTTITTDVTVAPTNCITNENMTICSQTIQTIPATPECPGNNMSNTCPTNLSGAGC